MKVRKIGKTKTGNIASFSSAIFVLRGGYSENIFVKSFEIFNFLRNFFERKSIFNLGVTLELLNISQRTESLRILQCTQELV